MTVRFTASLDSLDRAIAAKQQAIAKAARPAAQAMAQVFYDHMRRNVDALGRRTGKLSNAIYQVHSADNSAAGGVQAYHISWNASKAPHGHLVEMGWLQRYKVYVGSDGKWHTAVRPEARGKKRPKRRASQAEKDAYYVPLPTPKQHPGYAFARGALASATLAVAAGKASLSKSVEAA